MEAGWGRSLQNMCTKYFWLEGGEGGCTLGLSLAETQLRPDIGDLFIGLLRTFTIPPFCHWLFRLSSGSNQQSPTDGWSYKEGPFLENFTTSSPWLVPSRPPASPPEARPHASSSPPRQLANLPLLQEVSRSPTGTGPVP